MHQLSGEPPMVLAALIAIFALAYAAMGLEKIHFFWYVKKISGLALVGYLAGAGVFLVQRQLLA